ncbi:MAG: GNAT family protein [Rhodobacteraceae bacterium]|nr:GNAT family protein [Paracoccaceae bacterium]
MAEGRVGNSDPVPGDGDWLRLPRLEFRRNELELPIGIAVEQWSECSPPPDSPIEGRYCRVEPLAVESHCSDLFQAFAEDTEDRIWAYLPYGPFTRERDLADWIDAVTAVQDPKFHAIMDKRSGCAAGVASYLNITPAAGVIEVGHINFAPALQRGRAATEAMYLMMRRAFSELGYRRYEWKCDALNSRSRGAALRLGFSFEGIFRQATIYKGRNRDTAWYSIIDTEWQERKAAFEAWLDPGNFHEDGSQRRRLTDFMCRDG